MEIYDNLSVESLPNEEWRDVVGYEGKYKISNMGRLFLCGVYRDGRRYKPHIKKTSLDVGGYEYAHLTDFDGNVKTYKIHRLVAMAFIENPNKFPCIDHIDCNRTNNKANNLRWASYEMNANNPITRERLSIASKKYSCQDHVREKRRRDAFKPQNILARRQKIIRSVCQYSKDGVFIKEFDSITNAALSVNGKSTSITRVCKGRRPTAYGYIWKYKEEK